MSLNIMALVNGKAPLSSSAVRHPPPQQHLPDVPCPDYDAAVSRSNSNLTSNGMSVVNGTGNVHWSDSYESVAPLNVSRRPSQPDPNYKRYVYTYNMLANSTPIQFYISVEPYSGAPSPGKYQFRLSMRINGIERPLGEPVARHMSVDPRKLDFAVFVFPGKQGVPVGCLWSLRVWLRVDGTDHRLFGEDDLWVGKDPDFNAIGDASFARQIAVEEDRQVYMGYAGKALITFTARWRRIRDQLYKYSLEYEGGGVGDFLFSDFRMRVDNDPRLVTFLIYTVPSPSMPPGATHRIRVWIRSLVPLTKDHTTPHPLPFNDSYIYQRIFKMDDFKIGGRLEFNSLGSKLVMAFPHCDGPETINMSRSPVKLPDKEKEKEREREREREKLGNNNTSNSHGGHGGHIHYHGLPPGAQIPPHMLSTQATFANPSAAHVHQPSLYPPTHMNPTVSSRAPGSRERARSPPQLERSRHKAEII